MRFTAFRGVQRRVRHEVPPFFAVLRTGKPCCDCTADHEELLVKRNAPRWIRMLFRYGYITPSDAQRLRAA